MYEELARIAQEGFSDIIRGWQIFFRRAGIPLKIRFLIIDGTYVDVWVSPDENRYSYHWEQRAVRGLIHRHDNAPDHPEIPTYPKHFHNGSEENVEPSSISDNPGVALGEFLSFTRQRLSEFESRST